MFGEDAEGSVEFHEATHLTASDWGELQCTVRHRALRHFHEVTEAAFAQSVACPPAIQPLPQLLVDWYNTSRTRSIMNVPGFCLGGYFLKVLRNWAT